MRARMWEGIRICPGGPNPRIHTQHLRGRNTKVGGSNPPPATQILPPASLPCLLLRH